MYEYNLNVKALKPIGEDERFALISSFEDLDVISAALGEGVHLAVKQAIISTLIDNDIETASECLADAARMFSIHADIENVLEFVANQNEDELAGDYAVEDLDPEIYYDANLERQPDGVIR